MKPLEKDRRYGSVKARRRGAVLILVLIVFSALSLLSFGLCHRVRLQLKLSRIRGDNLQAYYLALGGIRRAMVALHADKDLEVDHYGEGWHLNTTAVEEGFFEDRGKGFWASASLSYAITDEESRLNILNSSPVGWVKLPGVTESTIYSILDWQDEDDSPYREGAETVYYLRQAHPYRAKNAPMALIYELSLVKGIDRSLFLGEDINGNMVLDDEGENDGPARWPMDDGDGELDHGLIDYFTVYGDGKVNLNTVGIEVLSALPEVDPKAADEIVSCRSGVDAQVFKTIDDLKNVPGVTDFQLELLKEYGKVQSNHFSIVSEARIHQDRGLCRLRGTVRRDEKGVYLISLKSDI